MDSIPLPPLTAGRYRFVITADEPMTLPPYLGSMLRGGFGVNFKRLVCMQPHLKQCASCMLLRTCAFPAVFEPAPPPDTVVLSSQSRIPVPYILQPPARREELWQTGDPISFGLVLLGQGIAYFPYFVLAFRELGRRGFGWQRKQGSLAGVWSMGNDGREETPLWEEEKLREDWRTQGLWHAQALAAPRRRISALTLRFLSPTRLKYQKTYVREAPPFHVLFRTLLRRVSSLSYFFGGQKWDIDYRGWIENARQIHIEDADVRWQDWDRYSTRQQQHMNIGGIVGQVTYKASNNLGTDLKPFLPLLRLGEIIHVGKGTSFGNGRYELIL